MTAFLKTAESYRPHAHTLPQNYFIAPEIFAQEKERISAQQCLCGWRQNQIPSSGDFFLAEILGESLIILRDQQGISSRAYRPGSCSPRQSIPAAFDRAYLQALHAGHETRQPQENS